MSKPEYLLKLEEKSRIKQQQFMDNITTRLRKEPEKTPPNHPSRGAHKSWREYNLPSEERIQLFMDTWNKLGGEAHRCTDLNSAGEFIAELAQKMQAHYLIRWDQPELSELNLESRLPNAEITVWNPEHKDALLTKAAGADIGICLVDYAVAHTGSVVVLSGPNKGRSVSLLPTAFVAVIKADLVKTRLGEVMEQLNQLNGGAVPAGVHFISGPSRSSDIENSLTIGVHGPGIVFAIIIG
jgi:L-lactate dehydrogenase complex protein LldG